MTEYQLAEKYNTSKDNIVTKLMNLGYHNTLLTKESIITYSQEDLEKFLVDYYMEQYLDKTRKNITHNSILDVDYKKFTYKPVENQSDNIEYRTV
jgi:hypothetical protein